MTDTAETPPYEMPDWERARHEAQAVEARDQALFTLRSIEQQEGRMVSNADTAIIHRTYRLPGSCR